MGAKVGHVHRYRRPALVELITSAGFTVERCPYVDSLGFAASLAYKAVGDRNGDLDESALAFYDRHLFPASRVLDCGLGGVLGKNLLLVATRPDRRLAIAREGAERRPRPRRSRVAPPH